MFIIGAISVFVVSAQTDKDEKRFHFWQKGEGCSYSKDKINSGYFDDPEKLELIKNKLALPDDASKEDVLNALKEKKTWKGYHKNFKEKLGISEDASEEEIKEAMQKYKEDPQGFKWNHKNK